MELTPSWTLLIPNVNIINIGIKKTIIASKYFFILKSKNPISINIKSTKNPDDQKSGVTSLKNKSNSLKEINKFWKEKVKLILCKL